MKTRAVTFDLWDTLVHDDSDEPKRAASGRRSKREERRHLVWEALNRDEPTDRQLVWTAYDAVDAAFNVVWKEQHVTWPVDQRLELVLRGLGRSHPGGWNDVVESTARMEVETPPDLIDGCRETLEALSDQYRLAIVSDAIVTPGTELRRLLATHEIERFFSAFAFSDEVGRSKPHPDMFSTALKGLGVAPDEAVHIGDRDHNDIRGAHAMGMKAVLFTATRDIDAGHTHADAVCGSYRELSRVIGGLA